MQPRSFCYSPPRFNDPLCSFSSSLSLSPRFLSLSSYSHSLYAASHFQFPLPSHLAPAPRRQPRDGDCADMSSACLFSYCRKREKIKREGKKSLYALYLPATFICCLPSRRRVLLVLFVCCLLVSSWRIPQSLGPPWAQGALNVLLTVMFWLLCQPVPVCCSLPPHYCIMAPHPILLGPHLYM